MGSIIGLSRARSWPAGSNKFLVVVTFSRSGTSRSSLKVDTTPQMTCFRGAKVVHKMATGKNDDELIQSDKKMRIGT